MTDDMITIAQETDERALPVPIYCPRCGEYRVGKLTVGVLFASRREPVVRCLACYVGFGLNWYPLDTEEDES